MALRSTLSLPDFDVTLYDRASPNEHICSKGASQFAPLAWMVSVVSSATALCY